LVKITILSLTLEKQEKKKKYKKIKNILIKLTKITFFGFFLFIVGIIFTIIVISAGIYTKYSKEFEEIKPQSNSTQLVFYDKNNNEIFRGYGAAEPTRIKLSDMPETVVQATLAAEDTDFYEHGAVDFKSLIRAVYVSWNNEEGDVITKIKRLSSEDSYIQGGSTITQQLVKNIYLTQERTFKRKIKEVIFAYKLESKYSKDEIMEMYLNEIYYGEQALGIENAATIYFGKNAKDLTLAEASILAGVPAAPTYYSPFDDTFENSKKRQEYVLQRMYVNKKITLEEAKEAANKLLIFSHSTEQTLNKYPYFNQFVKEEVAKELSTDNLSNSGIKVYTSLDPEKQDIAEEQVKIWLKKLSYKGATNSAVVIADPESNEILAMVGGVNWETSKVNVATSDRQPGSSFKPIVYATALENSYTAATILNDKYVNFGGIPAYIPRNYNGGYSGYVTLRNALARSLNIPAVEMAKLVGVDKIIDMAHNLGISGINNGSTTYGLSLALGSAEVKLVEMVEAYSTFADEGKRMPQTSILKILNKNNENISTTKRKKQQVISEETSFIISSILSDNTARSVTFGSSSPLKTEKITAVKTGTTDNYADSWTIGYSPSLVVGVWMGNNDHTSMKQVSGIEGAAYIWHDIITECLEATENEQFEKPDGIEEAWINPYTGVIATYKSAPNILEYFKKGTIPSTKVDLSYLKQF
jgi:1A family penicillin-binding protein